MGNRSRQPLILAGLIIVVVLALWLGPRLLSQAQLRAWAGPQIERALQSGIGADGDIRLVLLPCPLLAADKVKFTRDGRITVTAPRAEANLQLLPLLFGRLRLDELRLRDATLAWGEEPPVSAIDATLSLSGEARLVKGHATWRDLGFSFSASQTPSGKDASLRLDRGGELSLRLPDAPGAQGRFSAKLPDLSVLAPRLPAIAASVAADLQWQDADLVANTIQATIGDVDWRGKGRVGLGATPRAELVLRSSLVDLDRLSSPLGVFAPAAIALAPGLESDVSLALDQVIWRGKALQDAHLQLVSQHGETSIASAGVTLPGNSEVALFGSIVAGPKLEGSFEGKSDDLRQLLRWAGVEPEGIAPDRLHAARLAGDIKAAADEVSLERVRLKFDSSQLDLSATFRPGPLPALGLSFALDSLNADAYWPQTPEARPAAGPNGDGPAPAALAKPSPFVFEANVRGQIGRLSWRGVAAQNVVLDALWNGPVEAPRLGVSAAALDFGKAHLERLKAELTLERGHIGLDQFSAGLYGGTLSGSGSLVPESGAVSLHFALAQAQMRQALLDAADIGLADGVLAGEVDLASSGHAPAELQSHLNGSAKLAVSDGQIKGFDLRAADRALAEKPGIGSLLLLVQSGLTGGATHFSQLSGSAHIEQGVVTSDDIKLQADGGFATGTAKVDLPANMIDAHADFRLQSAADAPPLVMRLFGPLDSPRRVLDVKPLQQWLSEHGVKGAKPKDVLKSLLQGVIK